MSIFRNERGQSAVLSVLFLTVLLGMSAAVLDVGSWYRADRATQATADAAALAAAQALPHDPARAQALAQEYTVKNGGGNAEVTVDTTLVPNDTVRVRVERQAPGFFAQVFGIDSVEVGSRAAARSGSMSAARFVAPVVVNVNHPMLQCEPQPCFGEDTEIELHHLHGPGGGDAAGSFGLINLLHGDGGGSVGSAELAGWMLHGLDADMPLGDYDAVPSTMFNSSHFREAIAARVGTEVLFPIYRTLTGSGSNAEYEVIGWVGFRIAGFTTAGSNAEVNGEFTRVVWNGIQSQSGGSPSFGALAVSLIE